MQWAEFVCPVCKLKLLQPANAYVGHVCEKAKNSDIQLIRLDKAEPIDVCCDHEGCEAWVSGNDELLFSVSKAKAFARTKGWRCDKDGDWCPEHKEARVAAE